MQAVFTNTTGKDFILGHLSLTWIDVRNIFDSFQEDNDPKSEIIFKAMGKEKLKLLSETISRQLNTSNLRQDLKEKLTSFCSFLTSSDGVTMKID